MSELQKLIEVEKLAIQQLKEHELYPEWQFKFDRAKRRYGLCNHKEKTINLSKHLVELNTIKESKFTILHEIAHALVGIGHGHDIVWKMKVKSIGGVPSRCFSDNVETPKGKFVYQCINCKTIETKHKKLKRSVACYDCCTKYNYGKYSEKYKMQLIEQIK